MNNDRRSEYNYRSKDPDYNDPYQSSSQSSSYPQYEPYNQPPQKPCQQYPPPGKENTMIIPVVLIVVVLAILIPTISMFLLSSTDSGGGSSKNYYDNSGINIAISGSVEDRTQYYKIDIVKVSGGTLSLYDAKFKCIGKSGAQLYHRTYTQSNPSSLIEGDTTVYPIPSGGSAVNENSTFGDGETVDPASLDRPHTWENCYFAYLDSQSEGKVSSGDAIWIYKDYNDDGTDEVKTSYRFKILDGRNNQVLTKEF